MIDFLYISIFKHNQSNASKNKPTRKHNAAYELIQAQGIIRPFLFSKSALFSRENKLVS